MEEYKMPSYSKVREGKKGERAIVKPSHQVCDGDYSSPRYVYVNRDGGLPAAWTGSEVWTEFKIPKDFGVLSAVILSIDVSNKTATNATLFPTPLWISKTEIFLGQDLLETIYADDQLHETIGFRSYQSFNQINEVVNMSEDYDLTPAGLQGGVVSQRFYLPLEGTMLKSVRPYIAGYNSQWKLRFTFASSIVAHGPAGCAQLSEMQMILEQADLSDAEKHAVASAHKNSVVDSTFYTRSRQQEVLPLNTSSSGNGGTPLYLRSFKNSSAGLLVYTTVQNPVPQERLVMLPLATLQLQDAMGNKKTELLRGDFLKPFTWSDHIDSPYTTYTQYGAPTLRRQGVDAVFKTAGEPSNPEGANLYLIPFSASFQDAIHRGCDLGTFKMTTQEKLMLTPKDADGYHAVTTPAVYDATIAQTTAKVVNPAVWVDTMTTIISYDLGHLVVSNGDHYVSYA